LGSKKQIHLFWIEKHQNKGNCRECSPDNAGALSYDGLCGIDPLRIYPDGNNDGENEDSSANQL
jgi:hypothetical protein